MKALMIGASGYIGRSLSVELLGRGLELIACQHTSALPFVISPRLRSISIALTDVETFDCLLESEKPDVVVHLASTLVPSSDFASYIEDRRAIVDPTLKLVFRLAQRQIPFVFFSSGGAIYGRTGGKPVTEETECRPISLYGQAKLEQEEIIRFAGRTLGLRYLIVRPSNPFGGSQSLSGRQGLIAAILGSLREARAVQIYGDGQVVRDYIYIDDLTAAVAQLIVAGDRGVVNIGSGKGHSTFDVVAAVERATARKVRVKLAPPRAVDVPYVILDVSRATSLGVPGPRPFELGVSLFASQLGLL